MSEKQWAWMYNVSIGDEHFQFGSDKPLKSVWEAQEIVGIIVGSFKGHDINLLSEVTGTLKNRRFTGKAIIANDVYGTDHDIDPETKREVVIDIGQVQLREKTVFAR